MTVKTRHRSNNDISSDVEKLKAALFDTTQTLRGRANEVFSDSVNSVKDQSTVMRDNMADYTAKKPFKALGIALASGVVLGWFLGRR